MILSITKYNLSPKWIQLLVSLIFYFILIKLHYIDLNDNLAECMHKRSNSEPTSILSNADLEKKNPESKIMHTFLGLKTDKSVLPLNEINTSPTTEALAHLTQASPKSESTQIVYDRSNSIVSEIFETKEEGVLKEHKSTELITLEQPKEKRDISIDVIGMEASAAKNSGLSDAEEAKKMHTSRQLVDPEKAYNEILKYNKYERYRNNKLYEAERVIEEIYRTIPDFPDKYSKGNILKAQAWENKLLNEECEKLRAEKSWCGVSTDNICKAAVPVGSVIAGGCAVTVAAINAGFCNIS